MPLADTSQEPGQLQPWELPFAHNLYPSVTAFFLPDTVDHIKAVIMPKGLGEYPGYVLEFRRAPFLMMYDESCTPPDQALIKLLAGVGKSCAYIWDNSPLVQQYKGIGCPPSEGSLKLRHYLLVGGDSIVEILAHEAPTVMRFDKPESFNVEYSF